MGLTMVESEDDGLGNEGVVRDDGDKRSPMTEVTEEGERGAELRRKENEVPSSGG